MIDTMEKASVQDVAHAKALGMDLSLVEEMSLHHMRLDMHKKAFEMRDKEQTLTQEEANQLNARLQKIISHLEENYDYDQMYDYMVDFNSFVPGNEYYNSFSW